MADVATNATTKNWKMPDTARQTGDTRDGYQTFAIAPPLVARLARPGMTAFRLGGVLRERVTLQDDDNILPSSLPEAGITNSLRAAKPPHRFQSGVKR